MASVWGGASNLSYPQNDPAVAGTAAATDATPAPSFAHQQAGGSFHK